MPVVVSCYNRALDALATRARSARDLERWLRDRDYAAEEISEAIERLTATGLVDDAKFAEAFARSRLLDRGMSKRRVAAELSRHGVARDVADAALAGVIADEGVDEEASVEAAALKKARSLARVDRDVARRRLTGFLARRGYGGDMVRRVVARVLP